jgi:hypothetical protein
LVTEVSCGKVVSFGMEQFPTGAEKMASKVVQSEFSCSELLPGARCDVADVILKVAS